MDKAIVRVIVPTGIGNKALIQHYGPFDSKEAAERALSGKGWVLMPNVDGEVYKSPTDKRRATISILKGFEGPDQLPNV